MKVTKADFKIFATLAILFLLNKLNLATLTFLKRHWNSCLS